MMEMKRALLWYLVILVALAAGLYLFLELFVNKQDFADVGPDGKETPAFSDTDTPAPGRGASSTPVSSGDVQSEDIPPLQTGESTPEAGNSAAAERKPEVESSRPAASPAVTSPAGGNYTVQVAALASRAKADGVIAKLRNDGFPGGRIAADMGDEFNRVWIGSFATKAEALAFAGKLKGKGYNTYVRTVR